MTSVEGCQRRALGAWHASGLACPARSLADTIFSRPCPSPSLRLLPAAALQQARTRTQLGEDAHVCALQADAALQQRDELLEVPPPLVELAHLRMRCRL